MRELWRGLLELDLLLAPFVHPETGRLATLPDRLLAQFETLLECEDVDVHEWLLGRSKAPAEVTDVVAEIRRAGES